MEGRVLMRTAVYTLILCMWEPVEVMGSNGKTNVSSSSRPTVVNFGALFTLNSVIGRSAKPAIAAAVNDVNSDSSILQGTRLNMILRDTNCSGFIGTVEGKLLCIKLYSINNSIQLCF